MDISTGISRCMRNWEMGIRGTDHRNRLCRKGNKQAQAAGKSVVRGLVGSLWGNSKSNLGIKP